MNCDELDPGNVTHDEVGGMLITLTRITFFNDTLDQ